MYTPWPDCHLNNLGHHYVYENIMRTLKISSPEPKQGFCH